jgi:hypothetical protein
MRQKRFIRTTASHLPEQIQVTERRSQREVQSAFDRWFVPVKGKSWRGAAKIWLVIFEGGNKISDVVGISRVDDIDIGGEAGRTVSDGTAAADNNELDAISRQRGSIAPKFASIAPFTVAIDDVGQLPAPPWRTGRSFRTSEISRRR